MKAQNYNPAAFTYHGIAMDAQGEIIKGTLISTETKVHFQSSSGDAVYEQIDQVLTTDLGNFNIVVGNSSGSLTNFNDIKWHRGDHFLEIAIDLSGGNDHLYFGTVQLLPVPFALNSFITADGVPGTAGPLPQ